MRVLRGGPSAFNSPFGHGNCSHNICPLDNHFSGEIMKQLPSCFLQGKQNKEENKEKNKDTKKGKEAPKVLDRKTIQSTNDLFFLL